MNEGIIEYFPNESPSFSTNSILGTKGDDRTMTDSYTALMNNP